MDENWLLVAFVHDALHEREADAIRIAASREVEVRRPPAAE